MKRQISDDPVDFLNDEKTLCVHLQPLYEFLLSDGKFRRPLFGSFSYDKGRGGTNYLKGKKYDLDKLAIEFALPDFIHVDIKGRTLACSRCWCDIQLREA
jgi:hypothetical protein